MKTRLGFTTARSEATPLTEDGSGVRVWGVPISTEWWCDQWANAEARYRLTSLCLGDESMARDGPGRFTGLAAAALEQVGRWESSGVLVRGRAWADVGGGDGYYALALRLCGASRVILLDPSPPSAWAAPVLASAGVNVLTTDARCFDYSEIDSIGFLYVPDVQVEELLQRSRRLEQLVTSEIDDADVVRETCKEHGWSLRRLATTGTFFTVGEPSAIPGASSSEELWLLSGPAGAQPRSFPSRGESYEGDANEEAADSDEAGKDSPQACR